MDVDMPVRGQDTNLPKGRVKLGWSQEEDDKLGRLVEQHGLKNWKLIASELPGRDCKRCSERWTEHVNPDIQKGKWTAEEEAYANRLIQEFKAGLLPLTDGTTLRTFLSKLLNCDPMRISKKFVGSNCIGKQVFRRRGADVNNLTPDEIERTRFELSELEKKFLDRVAHSKNSSRGGGVDHPTSKSAAKAAATLGYMSSSDGGGGGGKAMDSGGGGGRKFNRSKSPKDGGENGGKFLDRRGGGNERRDREKIGGGGGGGGKN
jgi:hypothetical protein